MRNAFVALSILLALLVVGCGKRPEAPSCDLRDADEILFYCERYYYGGTLVRLRKDRARGRIVMTVSANLPRRSETDEVELPRGVFDDLERTLAQAAFVQHSIEGSLDGEERSQWTIGVRKGNLRITHVRSNPEHSDEEFVEIGMRFFALAGIEFPGTEHLEEQNAQPSATDNLDGA